MKSSKNIKVYGTLVNHTLDSTLADETHNDALMNAYQLFDGRFGDSPLPNNFQDVINKRITDITFDGGTTTIENRDEVPENHYTLVVNGDTNLNGDVHVTENLHVDGDTYVDGDTHIDGGLYVTGDISGINLDDLDDVNVPSPSEKDLLYFQNGLWRSGNISTVYGDDIVNIINNSSQVGWLSKLKDVDIVDRIDGQFLKYNVNGNNAKWMAANITLADIDDIADLQNAADNYVLKFYNGKWRPRPDDSGTQLPAGSEGKVLKYINGSWVAGDDNDTKQLSALNDVTLSTMAIGQVLRYDGSKWVNAKLSLSDLQMPAASNGQVLKFNGTEWVAGNDAGGVSRLSELQDVNISNPDNGAKLVYDAASGKWTAQGSGASDNVDIALGDLNNVTEQNKQNSSILIYDSTGNTWKPSMFGVAPTVTYSQQTVTFTKLTARPADGYHGQGMKASDTTADKLYPGANTAYLYSTTAAVTVPEGYTISSISPNSQFGSSTWNVVVYANDLAKSTLTNKTNVPFNINGHSKNFNVISLFGGDYYVRTADVTSATTTTSTSSRFGAIRPLSSNGNMLNYQRITSNKSFYVINAGDTPGSWTGPGISFSESAIDDINTYASVCTRTVSGKATSYERIDSDSNYATYDNYLTTRYATRAFSVGSNYDYSCVMNSLSRDAFLSQAYASGTTSPISIDANKIMFNFIANNNITYPDTFQATVVFAKTESSNTSIGGLSVVEGTCSTTTQGSYQYPVVPMSINDAKNVICCTITVIPKSGAVDNNGNAVNTSCFTAGYNQQFGGFGGGAILYGGAENYDSITYKYIKYTP